MISLILVALAAICSAFMDATENENFFESILKDRRQSFWYKRESWKTAPRIFGYKLDAWHLFKSLMVILMALAIVFYVQLISWWADVVIYGIVWNVSFVLFYHKILKVK